MTKIKNSLSTYLEQAMVMTGNSLETIDKISNAVSSSEDSVKLVLTDPNDPKKKVEYIIPSFGYLKSEIDRLSASLNTMTNITDGAGSRIRLSDGTYRKIIASKVPSEAPTITHVDNITNFNFKSNWFFEDMLNPCLYVTWDMSSQISPETERVSIQRFILKCDTQAKIDAFNSNLKGRNDVDYKEFLTFLLNNRIKYTLDDEIKDLPPRARRYYGTFSVVRIEMEKDLNGNNVKRYILDSLEFTDTRSGFENTRLLTVGDMVEVNSNPTTTRYEVIFVDSSENKIGLKCVEGCEGVRIGAETLKISASQDTLVSADIPIGFDEREVIFVKAIDPDSNIPSNKWSPGVAFYTNDLTYVDDTGATQTLQKFYQKNVVDFGQVLLSYAYDYYPSIREGIIPNTPVLNFAGGEGDFKIVQINTQLTESTDAASFRSLVSDKAKVQSELDNIANEISKQKELIQTTQYISTNDKLAAQTKLNTLVDNQSILASNYNSIVNNIKARYESGNVATPKYRVRGFWDIPDSKISPSSGEQKIIKFKIRYRYLSEYGNANKEEEFTYTSGNASVTGRFSNWNEIETKTRERVKTSTGWEWKRIDTADPDEVNINQLDIPINPGEQVEIQVKSVSEAGWPSNPLESDWSDPITVSFSDFAELQADDITELIEQNRVDAAVANVTKMFSGTAAHMSSSFYTNDKYFAHTAESITSGFLTPEQTPITLYDKLQDLQNQISMIIEQINGTMGDIKVNLFDDSDEQKVYSLIEGGTTYVYAGDYLSVVNSLDPEKRKGAIVTKTYYLDISTDAQSGLFLLSKLTGDRLSMCPSTVKDENQNVVTSPQIEVDEINGNETINDRNDYASYDNVITPSSTSGSYYYEQGRYDLVPINLTNPDILDFQIGSPSMYQSAQCRGQFVYSRFRNIGDTFDMYANCVIDGRASFRYNKEFTGSECEYNPSFGVDNNFNGYGYNQDESIEPQTTLKNEYCELTGSDKDSLTYNQNMLYFLNRLPKTWTKTDSASVRVLDNRRTLIRVSNLTSRGGNSSSASIERLSGRISRLATSNSTAYTIIPKIQTTYGFADFGKIHEKRGNMSFDTDGTSFVTTHKIGYEERDRYAVGPNTCNSYLFLSPINHNEIQVEGDTMESSKKLKAGESLKVPIIYQFRMTDYSIDANDEINQRGYIFGDSSLSEGSKAVKTTKFANIIGIDIWTDRNAIKPKQYDIIVYSTYSGSTETNTSRTKTSSKQTLINVGNEIVNKLDKLTRDSKTLSSTTTTTRGK